MNLNQQVSLLNIVVASPGDVQAERDMLPELIAEINRSVAADRNLRLELSRWETDTHPGFHADGPQGTIDPLLKIEDCDLLIGVFWHRFGTPTKDAGSGTEHKFRLAYQTWRTKGRPQLMVYFNQKAYTPKSKQETDQWGKVLDFRNNFPKEGLWWPYRGKAQFTTLVRNHLTQYVRTLNPEASAAEARLRGQQGLGQVGQGSSETARVAARPAPVVLSPAPKLKQKQFPEDLVDFEDQRDLFKKMLDPSPVKRLMFVQAPQWTWEDEPFAHVKLPL